MAISEQLSAALNQARLSAEYSALAEFAENGIDISDLHVGEQYERRAFMRRTVVTSLDDLDDEYRAWIEWTVAFWKTIGEEVAKRDAETVDSVLAESAAKRLVAALLEPDAEEKS